MWLMFEHITSFVGTAEDQHDWEFLFVYGKQSIDILIELSFSKMS